MPRIAYVILSSCLVAFAALGASSANAGGHDDGYTRDVTLRPHRVVRVWYSSNCCFRKIVRHERKVRYVRTPPPRYRPADESEPPRYRRHDGKHERPYRQTYDVPRHHAVADNGYGGRVEHCHRKRVRVLGADGGAVWALTARCY